MSQHSASSSPPPRALPSIAAIVGIGSAASACQVVSSSWRRARPAGTARGLELARRATRAERAVAAAAHDDRPHVARVRGGEASDGRGQLLDELGRDEVERRVDELEVRDRPELELDEVAHGAAAKSAARPIGPVAYRRRSIGPQVVGDPGPEAHLPEHVALDVDPGRDLDQHQAVVLEREHRALGDVADLLAALAGEAPVERDLAHPRHELAELALVHDPDAVVDLELEALGRERADEVDPAGLRARCSGSRRARGRGPRRRGR